MIHYRIDKRFHVLGAGVQSVSRSWPNTAVTPYWLTFDGTNDYIVLPDGEGDEPTTAVTVECWMRLPSTIDGAAHSIIQRGDSTNDGYSLNIEPETSNIFRFRFYCGSTNTTQTTGAVYNYSGDYTRPIHVAASYDGTYKRYFLNGAMVLRESATGAISYSDASTGGWEIGRLNGSLWPSECDVSMIRISNSARYTESFTPPQTMEVDANTIYLANCGEGSGTSLADSSSGGHTGTFKAAGEPAWGSVVDLTTTHGGATLWANVLDIVPNVTDTNVYVHRTSADAYEAYYKIGSGYWVKLNFLRDAALNMKGSWVGTPTPNDDDPTGWTVDPATALGSDGGVNNEYALNINGTFMGNNHSNETLTSEQWYKDDVAWNPGNGDWGNGAVFRYDATTDINDGTSRGTLVKSFYIDRALNYVYSTVTFTTALELTTFEGYPAMFDMLGVTAFDKVTLINGGTDYDWAGAGDTGLERSICIAAWKTDGAQVAAFSVGGIWPDLVGMMNTGAFHKQNTGKAYLPKTKEAYVPASKVYTWESRWAFLDNCGNHFLKTT